MKPKHMPAFTRTGSVLEMTLVKREGISWRNNGAAKDMNAERSICC